MPGVKENVTIPLMGGTVTLRPTFEQGEKIEDALGIGLPQLFRMANANLLTLTQMRQIICLFTPIDAAIVGQAIVDEGLVAIQGYLLDFLHEYAREGSVMPQDDTPEGEQVAANR